MKVLNKIHLFANKFIVKIIFNLTCKREHMLHNSALILEKPV